MKWTQEKPKEPGFYLRSNPVVQRDITKQIVFREREELWSYHPSIEGRRTKIQDMPAAFWWMKIPIPPHYRMTFDYDIIN